MEKKKGVTAENFAGEAAFSPSDFARKCQEEADAPAEESEFNPNPKTLIAEQLSKLNEEYAVRNADLLMTLQTLEDSDQLSKRKRNYLRHRESAIKQDKLSLFLKRDQKDEEFARLLGDFTMRQAFLGSMVTWAERFLTTEGGLDKDAPELCEHILAMAQKNKKVRERLDELDDEIFYYFRAQERAYGEPPRLQSSSVQKTLPFKALAAFWFIALIFGGVTAYVVLRSGKFF